MSATEEIQDTELKLLQEYVNIIMDILEAILKDNTTSYKYLTELSKRIMTQLQEQYLDYIFYVGKRCLTHSCLPMDIPTSPANFAQLLEQHNTQKRRCKWCNDILH